MPEVAKSTPPITIHRPAGSVVFADREVILRPLGSADRDAILRFARRLPAHDLRFLRRDITDSDDVEDWLANVARGSAAAIIALSQNEIVGYATVDRGRLRWTAHVGEIRVLIDPSVRGGGLGAALLQIVFDAALEAGVRKLVAQMTADQGAAATLFRRLGFEQEVIRRGHAMDVDGQLHDLLVLSLIADDLENCDGCDRRVVRGMTLEGKPHCWACYELRAYEYGSSG